MGAATGDAEGLMGFSESSPSTTPVKYRLKTTVKAPSFQVLKVRAAQLQSGAGIRGVSETLGHRVLRGA
jgi:hypothetical protein